MTLKLGIVGGGGWLGGAIARAVLDTGLVAAENLTLAYRSAEPQGFTGVHCTRDSRELAARADVIVLSVRPEDWPAVEFDAAGKLVISVMAGVGIDAIAARHGTTRVVRTLPNAAAEVGASYTPYVGSAEACAEDLAMVRAIFGCCGSIDQVASEAQLDYLSGLTGTGPAYPALMALAMERDAVARGLDPAVARRAVTALFVGTGRMMEAGSNDHAATVEAFLAYRGLTAAGLEAMRAAGFDAAVGAGLAAAYAKAQAMGAD